MLVNKENKRLRTTNLYGHTNLAFGTLSTFIVIPDLIRNLRVFPGFRVKPGMTTHRF